MIAVPNLPSSLSWGPTIVHSGFAWGLRSVHWIVCLSTRFASHTLISRFFLKKKKKKKKERDWAGGTGRAGLIGNLQFPDALRYITLFFQILWHFISFYLRTFIKTLKTLEHFCCLLYIWSYLWRLIYLTCILEKIMITQSNLKWFQSFLAHFEGI